MYIYVCICIYMYMCPPGYHNNGFIATDVFGHNRTSCAQVYEVP